jgi:hypothetical protein
MTIDPKVVLHNRKAFFMRVLRDDATRRGAAAAGAGVLMALVHEAAWPGQPSPQLSGGEELSKSSVGHFAAIPGRLIHSFTVGDTSLGTFGTVCSTKKEIRSRTTLSLAIVSA